ncbi:unnamed protein product, partial [marine sediment metagenome]
MHIFVFLLILNKSFQFRVFRNIQLIEGESIYKEFLDQGREGLHHISLFVEDIDSYIEYFE